MAQSDIQILFCKKDKYKETRERICKYNPQYKNCSDKEIIEYLADEIDYYRNKIEKLEDIRRQQNKYIEKIMTLDEIIKDILELKPVLQFETMIGTIENIKFVKESTAGDVVQNMYEIELLRDDMYSIKINPIAEGTIRDIFKKMKVIGNDKIVL